MTRVTLPDGRLGPSSLTTHTRLSGRPQEAVTAATVPLAQYSASSDPAARSTVLHWRRHEKGRYVVWLEDKRRKKAANLRSENCRADVLAL